ncbi:hypothetical protein D1872_267890 [compost metagenome]
MTCMCRFTKCLSFPVVIFQNPQRSAEYLSLPDPLLKSIFQQGLRKEQVPHASSATRILQQIGGAFGASVLAVILQNQMTSPSVNNITMLNTAFNHTFMWTVGFALISLIFISFLPNKKSSKS